MNATAALGDARSGLPTRALEAEAAQYAFQLGYTRPDALEVVTGERDEPHRRACDDCGRPVSP